MSRKQLVTLVGAACSSLLLAACFPELPDSVPYPDSGSVPVTERQTLEAFVSGTMPRYMSIIEEVAMESGGVIADVGHSESWACRSAVNGYEIMRICAGLSEMLLSATGTVIRRIRFLGIRRICVVLVLATRMAILSYLITSKMTLSLFNFLPDVCRRCVQGRYTANLRFRPRKRCFLA